MLAIAAIHQNDETVLADDQYKSPFGSSFRTIDGCDYSNIATIDVKRNIYDLCVDMKDMHVAVVEVRYARARCVCR